MICVIVVIVVFFILIINVILENKQQHEIEEAKQCAVQFYREKYPLSPKELASLCKIEIENKYNFEIDGTFVKLGYLHCMDNTEDFIYRERRGNSSIIKCTSLHCKKKNSTNCIIKKNG